MVRSVTAARKQRQQRQGLLLIVVAITLGAAVVGLYLWRKGKLTSLDSITLCPLDGPHGSTVLLIDRTEPLNAIQRADLRTRLAQLRDSLPVHSAIEIYAIGTTDGGVLHPIGPTVCNPGSGKDLSPLVANPSMVEKQWRERFVEPLDRLFEQLLAPRDQPTSPILESIQSVGITAYPRPTAKGWPRRLIIASDMLQNTPELSQYIDEITFAKLQSTAYYQRVRASLDDLEVEILYIRRDTGRQGAAHISFWQEYFADCGAHLIHVTKVAG